MPLLGAQFAKAYPGRPLASTGFSITTVACNLIKAEQKYDLKST